MKKYYKIHDKIVSDENVNFVFNGNYTVLADNYVGCLADYVYNKNNEKCLYIFDEYFPSASDAKLYGMQNCISGTSYFGVKNEYECYDSVKYDYPVDQSKLSGAIVIWMSPVILIMSICCCCVWMSTMRS
jgi:hypothetical protein